MKSFLKCYLATLMLFVFSCTDDTAETPTPISEIPDQLTATWLNQDSYFFQNPFDPTLYDSRNNSWYHGHHSPWDMDPDPGRGIQIQKNGDFVWTLIHDTGVGSCRSTAATYVKGKAAVDGNNITFSPTVRRAKYRSVCNPSLDFDRDDSKASFTLSYEVLTHRDEAGNSVQALKLINPDGSYSLFYK